VKLLPLYFDADEVGTALNTHPKHQ